MTLSNQLNNNWQLWQFLKTKTISDNFDNLRQLWLFLTTLTISDNFDNPGDLWLLRHWLQFWQLRTWIHDSLCYLTIKSDTGQHSQFLRCFICLRNFFLCLRNFLYVCRTFKDWDLSNWQTLHVASSQTPFSNMAMFLVLMMMMIVYKTCLFLWIFIFALRENQGLLVIYTTCFPFSEDLRILKSWGIKDPQILRISKSLNSKDFEILKIWGPLIPQDLRILKSPELRTPTPQKIWNMKCPLKNLK